MTNGHRIVVIQSAAQHPTPKAQRTDEQPTHQTIRSNIEYTQHHNPRVAQRHPGGGQLRVLRPHWHKPQVGPEPRRTVGPIQTCYSHIDR